MRPEETVWGRTLLRRTERCTPTANNSFTRIRETISRRPLPGLCGTPTRSAARLEPARRTEGLRGRTRQDLATRPRCPEVRAGRGQEGGPVETWLPVSIPVPHIGPTTPLAPPRQAGSRARTAATASADQAPPRAVLMPLSVRAAPICRRLAPPARIPGKLRPRNHLRNHHRSHPSVYRGVRRQRGVHLEVLQGAGIAGDVGSLPEPEAGRRGGWKRGVDR